MSELDDYRDRFGCVAFDRSDDGVLEIRLHTDGDSLRWGVGPHGELREAFWHVGNDRGNRVVVLTGTGAEFSGPVCTIDDHRGSGRSAPSHAQWDDAFYVGRQLHTAFLNIEVPVIAAINGPVYRHAEIPLLADVVIAAYTTVFVDSGHFEFGGLVPGDGINVIMSALLGPNRARYFHLMGEEIDAEQALRLGLVGEVVPKGQELDRARVIAHHMAKKPTLHLRYSKAVLVEPLKEQLQRWVGYGLALEGLALTDPTASFEPGDPGE